MQEKGVTRSDVLAGRGEAEQPLRRFQVLISICETLVVCMVTDVVRS